MFCPDGSLDRQKLGTLVFSDHAALDRLNAIVYEYLPPELLRRAQERAEDAFGGDAFQDLYQ